MYLTPCGPPTEPASADGPCPAKRSPALSNGTAAITGHEKRMGHDHGQQFGSGFNV